MNTILIHLPTWLGDAVMASAVIEQIKLFFPNAKLTVVGSNVSAALFSRDERVLRIVVDGSKKSRFRLLGVYELAKEVGCHDMSVTFRNSFLSALFLKLTGSKVRVGFSTEMRSFLLTESVPYKKGIHQVLRYGLLSERFCDRFDVDSRLSLCAKPVMYGRKTVGICPGATFGDAKRWSVKGYADVATALIGDYGYDIVLFGSPAEKSVCDAIESLLAEDLKKGVVNLASKTTVEQLMDGIAGLSMMICNDSGPMHIAASFGIPTVSIFGPTDFTETSPWKNKKAIIVRKEMDCSPCKKRVCPLGHHDCMKKISTEDVLEAVEFLRS